MARWSASSCYLRTFVETERLLKSIESLDVVHEHWVILDVVRSVTFTTFNQGAVIQSVLNAAKCKKLRFLDTANHKSKDGNSGRTETFNDAGIYRNSALARDATDIDPKRLAKSKMSPAQLKERLLGARSWFWMDVPVEVKGDEKNSAFYFKTKPKGSWADSESKDKKVVEPEGQNGGGEEQEVEDEDEDVEEADEADQGGDNEIEVVQDGDVGEEDDEVNENEDEDEDEEAKQDTR